MSKRRIMTKANIAEISAVDRPAQEPALVALFKRAPETAAIPEPSETNKSAAGGSNTEPTMTPEQILALQKQAEDAAKALVETTKRAERAERLATLSDVQKSHLAGLPAEQQEQFLALEPKARETEVAAQVAKRSGENPVTETVDGQEFRKNDDPRLLIMAKALKTEREARETLAKSERLVRMQKRAGEELGNLPGAEGVKVAMLEALDTIPAELKAGVSDLVKAANSALAKAFVKAGTREGAAPESSEFPAICERVAKSLREKNPKLSEAQAYAEAMNTPEARAAYRR